jgi:DNA-directed RNA polymerase subunit beta'
MVCEPFGADFDGDTMSLHLPLSEEAQKECDDIMVSTRGLLKPSSGETTMSPTKDIVLGCY